MKIKFLGTNHGMGDSKLGRYCQSILIESGERSYLFDAGAPAVEILEKQGYDLSKIKAVFVSHAHDDHIHYLPDVCSCEKINAKFYLPDVEQMEHFVNAYNRKFFKICEGNFYNDLFVKVSSVKTKHLLDWEENSISHGFLFEAEGKKVHVTGDMTAELNDFPVYLNDSHVDVIISECAHPEVKLLFDKLDNCNADKVCVLHVYPEEKYEELNARIGKNDFELILPKDGDEIEL